MPLANVIIERRRVKNARLRVTEAGVVGLIVPEHFTDEQVDGLLFRKTKWIEDKRRFFAHRTPVKHRLNPNEVRLFGETFLFVHAPSFGHRSEIDYKGRLVRTGADLADAGTRQRWYRRFAKEYLHQRTNAVADFHGFSFHKLYIRAPWKHWGSCSAKRNISLNWRLIEAPKEVIEYVILHELLHTRLMTHDHRFWAHLRAICPGAQRAQDWLERNRPQQ